MSRIVLLSPADLRDAKAHARVWSQNKGAATHTLGNLLTSKLKLAKPVYTPATVKPDSKKGSKHLAYGLAVSDDVARNIYNAISCRRGQRSRKGGR